VAKVSDLEKVLAQRPTDRAIDEARLAFTSMQKVLDASGLGASTLANSKAILAASGLSTSTLANVKALLDASGLGSAQQAAQALSSSSLDEITKSPDKATKALLESGTMAYVREANKSLNAAQGVLGKIDLPRKLPALTPPDRDVPIPRLQVDAALLTRDAVVDLTSAVELLVEETERSSRRIVKLNVAIAVMSALLVLLTAFLLVLAALPLVHL
jgi:hypothetical protein